MKPTNSRFLSASIPRGGWSLLLLVATATLQPLAASEVLNDAGTPSFNAWPQDRPVRAQFVHRPARHSPEWQHYRAMEKYYDDLDDYFRHRDRYLSEYYEQFEEYYEDLRKGRPAFYPNVQPHHIFPHGMSDLPAGMPHPATAVQTGPRVWQDEPANVVSPQIQSPSPTLAAPRSELERSYRELLSQLSGLTTGDRWQTYLQLPVGQIVGQQTNDSRWEQLNKAADRYERILADPDYQMIAELPAFEATRNQLHQLLDSFDLEPTLAEPEPTLADGPTLAEPELAPAEEIPLPGPVLPSP